MTDEQRRRLQVLNNFQATSPMKVTVAGPRNLMLGNTVIAPNPNAVAGGKASQPRVNPQIANAPKQSFVNKVRDQFDANTLADQYRRQMEGRPRIVEDPGNLYTQANNAVKTVAKETIRAPFRLAAVAGDAVNGKEQFSYTPGSRVEKYLLGDKPIKNSYSEGRAFMAGFDKTPTKDTTAERVAKVGGGAALAVLDAGGLGGIGRSLFRSATGGFSKKVVKGLATAKDAEAVERVLGTQRGVIPDEYINLLASEKDPKAIEAIVKAVEDVEVRPQATRPPDGEASVEALNDLKNSLKNDATGIKPGGVERAAQEIENGTALPIRVRTLEDGTQVIEDGRHRLEAAHRLGIQSYPVEDVTARYNPEQAAQEVAQQVDEVTPPAPPTQAAQVEQAVEQAAEAPLVAGNPEATTAALEATDIARAADAAQTPSLSPSQLVAEAVDAADASKGRYGDYGKLQKIKDAVDPRNRAIDIDRAAAKAQGMNRRDLPAEESMDAMIERTTQSKQIADQMLKGSNIEAFIRATGSNPDEIANANLYRLFKRDIEQRLDGRPPLNVDRNGQPFNLEDMQRFVDEFDSAFPEADAALRAMSKDIQDAQDFAVSQGVVPAEDVAAARLKKDGTQYQYYTPATRAMPEDKVGPSISAQNVGTLGRQKVLQDFTGSMLPVDPSFDAVTDYVETIVRQANQAQVSQLYAKRTAEGFTDAKVIQTGDEAARIDQLKATQRELQETMTSLKKEIIRTNSSARVAGQRLKTAESKLKTADTRATLNSKAATKEAVRRETEAVARAKDVLKRSLAADDPDAIAAMDSLSNDELMDLLAYASQDELFSKGVSGAGKLRSAQSAAQKAAKAQETTKTQQAALQRIAQTSEAHAGLVQKAIDMNLDLASLKSAKGGVREQILELTPDPFTGQQTILGRDINGNPFRIEVPPEDANLLQGFNNENINDVLKVVGAAQRPFREAFTGILNVPFQIAQATFNAFMLPITSKAGIKVYGAKSIEASLKSINLNNELQQALSKGGAIRYSGGYNQLPQDAVSDAISAQATTLGKIKWYANPKRAWNQLSQLGGRLDMAARTAAADAVKRQSLAAGRTYDEAIADAVYEYNNALPNFANASSFLKGLDNAVMYTNPSVAGTRTLFRVVRDNPIKTTAKLGAGALGLTGVTAYSLAQDNGQDFYADMHRAGKDYILDNNVIFVLPGAKKDAKTGEWTGIVKIPLAPEMRPINRAVHQAFNPSKTGQDGKTYARAMFDFLTGQIASSSNPVANVVAGIATGTDPRSGYDIYDETLSPEDKASQIKKYLIGSFGTVGKQIAGQTDTGVVDSLTDKVYGAKGLSEGGNFYKTQDEAIKSVGLNKNELDAYRGTVSPTSKDLAGNKIKEKTFYDSASKALTWLRYPKTFEVSKRIDAEARKKGKPGDPIFDLPEDQRKLIITLQSNPSSGNKEEKAIARLNPWIADFYKQRSAYYDQVKSTLSKEDQKKFGIDPNGITIPKASDSVQARMDYATSLTDSKAKAEVYREPDVADYMADQNAYQRAKRAFMGLPQFDDYPTPDAATQKIMDQYSALPKGNGPPKKDGTASSPDRSAWIKSHPNEWAAMSSAFDKIGAWTAADEGSLAVYEGINSEGDAGAEVASTDTDGGSSYSYGGKNYKYDANGNIVEAEDDKQYLVQQLPGTLKLPSMPELSRDSTRVIPFKIKKPRQPTNNKRLRLKV